MTTPIKGEQFTSGELSELSNVNSGNLKMWLHHGHLRASVREATGTGTPNLFSFRDLVVFRIASHLRRFGIDWDGIKPLLAVIPDGDLEALPGLPILVRTWLGEVRLIDEADDAKQMPDEGWATVRVPLWYFVKLMRAQVSMRATKTDAPLKELAQQLALERFRRENPEVDQALLSHYHSLPPGLGGAGAPEEGAADGKPVFDHAGGQRVPERDREEGSPDAPRRRASRPKAGRRVAA